MRKLERQCKAKPRRLKRPRPYSPLFLLVPGPEASFQQSYKKSHHTRAHARIRLISQSIMCSFHRPIGPSATQVLNVLNVLLGQIAQTNPANDPFKRDSVWRRRRLPEVGIRERNRGGREHSRKKTLFDAETKERRADRRAEVIQKRSLIVYYSLSPYRRGMHRQPRARCLISALTALRRHI